MEKYHNVEKANSTTIIKKNYNKFIEKLRNLNILPFIINKFDFSLGI